MLLIGIRAARSVEQSVNSIQRAEQHRGAYKPGSTLCYKPSHLIYNPRLRNRLACSR